MQPYSVLNPDNSPRRQPPKPVIWTSKHSIQLKAHQIPQPHIHHIQPQTNSINRKSSKQSQVSKRSSGGHLIDLHRSSLKGFTIKDSSSHATSKSHIGQSHIHKTQSNYLEDAASPKQHPPSISEEQYSPATHVRPTRDIPEENAEEEVHNQYQIRMKDEAQVAQSHLYYPPHSFTRKLIHDIGQEQNTSEVTPPHKMKNTREGTKEESYIKQFLVIQPEIQWVQIWNSPKNIRALGKFQRAKNYTNQFVFTNRQLRTLVGDQSKASASHAPLLSSSVFRNLQSMKIGTSLNYSHEDPHQQSRVSQGSQSHHSKRHPIFVNSKVQHFDQSSRNPIYIQQSNRSNKSNKMSKSSSSMSGIGMMSKEDEIIYKEAPVVSKKDTKISIEHKNSGIPQHKNSEIPQHIDNQHHGQIPRIPIFGSTSIESAYHPVQSNQLNNSNRLNESNRVKESNRPNQVSSHLDNTSRKVPNITTTPPRQVTFGSVHQYPSEWPAEARFDTRHRINPNIHSSFSDDHSSPGRQPQNNFNRNLIFQGGQQRNQTQKNQSVVHRRVLTRSSKVPQLQSKVSIKGFNP